MKKSATLGHELLLLLTALIWGMAFVAQRVGMDYIGPFLYNGIRFTLGGLSLIPLYLIMKKRIPRESDSHSKEKLPLVPGILAGIFLFAGSSFQQIGIVNTSAGNAGFITGLYVVLVPLIGSFFGQRSGRQKWMGAILALAGLYFLSVGHDFSIAPGDFWVLISAFFWAGHVLFIGRICNRHHPVLISIIQFLTTAVLSLMVAVFTEPFVPEEILGAAMPIAYGGFFSVGIAYTLQVVAQKKVPSAHAAIILSLESLFAAIGGILLLAEPVTGRRLFGCALMLLGMLVSQGIFRNLSLKFRRLADEE